MFSFARNGIERISPARTVLGAGLLIAVGFWIYGPAIFGKWLWDDGLYLANNALVQSPDGYWKVWTHFNPLGKNVPGNYYPLLFLVEWGEWRIFGNDTLGYHVVSVVLHITSALLLWNLFSRLGFSFAWVGALLFLTHPTAVESVAWISELKNTLSLPLLLMAILRWIDYEEKGSLTAYGSALLWFILSMAAKTAGLMVPLMFLAYAWWKRGKIEVKDVRALFPFLAVAAIAGLMTLAPPETSGAYTVALRSWNAVSSVASVGWTVFFLFGRCFFPVELLADYPGFAVMEPKAVDLLPWLFAAGFALLLGLGWRRAEWIRFAGWGLAFFLINLLPVVAYIGKDYSEMVWSLDHLLYLPIIGLIGFVIAIMGEMNRRLGPHGRFGLCAGIGAILLIFIWGSHAYARVFGSEDSLMAYMLDREPQNAQIHYLRGTDEMGAGHDLQAIAQFQQAIELDPASDKAHEDLGRVYRQTGQNAEAKENFLEAIRLNPREVDAYLSLSEILQQEGNIAEAEKYLNTARLMAPDDETPLVALAGLMIQSGRAKEGFKLYLEAVTMRPYAAPVRYDFGMALLQAKDFPAAAEQLQTAVYLDGNSALARENFGLALALTNRIPEAIAQFRAALDIDPSYLAARDNLALAYAQTGRIEEAIEQYQKVLATDPKDADAGSNLPRLLSLRAAAIPKNSP